MGINSAEPKVSGGAGGDVSAGEQRVTGSSGEDHAEAAVSLQPLESPCWSRLLAEPMALEGEPSPGTSFLAVTAAGGKGPRWNSLWKTVSLWRDPMLEHGKSVRIKGQQNPSVMGWPILFLIGSKLVFPSQVGFSHECNWWVTSLFILIYELFPLFFSPSQVGGVRAGQWAPGSQPKVNPLPQCWGCGQT